MSAERWGAERQRFVAKWGVPLATNSADREAVWDT